MTGREDVSEHNRLAWNRQVDSGNRWTVPVTREVIASARAGSWQVVLTPEKSVPRHWFPDLEGLDLLALASGGGQQAPIFAALGARVTVLDQSERQLEQDRHVADRDGLCLATERGDMRDLSRFPAESFDLVFNPCSVAFIPEVRPVFEEAHRVLRPGGLLMCGFVNPIRYVFDEEGLEAGRFLVRHALPYSDGTHLDPGELEKLRNAGEPLVFSHSLEDLIGGQLQVGFRLRDLYEDVATADALSRYLPAFLATLAEKEKAGDTRAGTSRGGNDVAGGRDPMS